MKGAAFVAVHLVNDIMKSPVKVEMNEYFGAHINESNRLAAFTREPGTEIKSIRYHTYASCRGKDCG